MAGTSENWIKYTTQPTKEQLQKDLGAFIATNPKFQGKIKVGKTSLEKCEFFINSKVGVRYLKHDKYEALKRENVFCELTSEKIAFAVERECQEIVKERGMLIAGSDNAGGGESKSTKRFIVYVTIEKPVNERCSFCLKYFTNEDEQKQHVRFYHIELARKWEKGRRSVYDSNKQDTEKGKEFIELANRVLKWFD